MNYHQRQEAAAKAARAKFAKESSQAFAQYGYDVNSGTMEEYPSEIERQFAMNELKLLKLRMSADLLNKIVNPSKKSSCSCGCSGSSKGKKNHFAKHYQQLVCESNDAAYETWCRKCL